MKKTQKLTLATQDGVEVVPGDVVFFPDVPHLPLALTGPWEVKSTGTLVRRTIRRKLASPMVRAILKMLEGK